MKLSLTLTCECGNTVNYVAEVTPGKTLSIGDLINSTPEPENGMHASPVIKSYQLPVSKSYQGDVIEVSVSCGCGRVCFLSL